MSSPRTCLNWCKSLLLPFALASIVAVFAGCAGTIGKEATDSGTGSDDAGSDDAGSDDAGSDDAGSDDAGSDDAGSDSAGSDDAGSDDAGMSDGDQGQADEGPVVAFCVRADAAGAGDGSDWNNAFPALPANLQRGATYFIADGDYPGYDFDDPAAGGNRIAVHKATDSLHGTDTGWLSQYGDGQASFGPVAFSGDDYLLDGTVENGLRFVGAFQGLVADIDGAHITLRRCELDGNFALSGGQHSDGACNVANINGDDITLDRCDLHNAADDGVGIYGRDIRLLHCKVHRLHGCGTDGACGPCYNGHSDGLELQNTTNVTLVGNMVYDIESTAALITGQWTPGNYTRNLVMINNIFYTPATGLTVYIYYVQTAHIYNNVIWGRSQGNRYGGLAVGPEATDIHMHNNIILNINYSHLGASFDAANHHFDYNLYGAVNSGEYSINLNEIVADPLFAAIPLSDDMNAHIEDDLVVEDFALTADSPAVDTGTNLSGEVDQDIVGRTRPVDGDGDGQAAWDIGAHEYPR